MFQIKDKKGSVLTTSQVQKKAFNRMKNIFLDFKLMFLSWIGNIPSHLIRRGFYRLAGIRIGTNSTIHMWARFYDPKNIRIGIDTIIGDHAFLDGRDKLEIGNHVAIASQVLIYNSQHDINNENFAAIYGKVIIEDYVFIGPRVIILPGVTIEKGAVVAAGAVVSKDVKAFTIVGGVPASPIGERKNKNPHYVLGRARLFQ
jgi:acetyltransferase-like isoleucine patch superfamily enzyme